MFNQTGSSNQNFTKLAPIVHVRCESMCVKFYNNWLTFNRVTDKKPMDPSSRTRDCLPSVLYLRGLWYAHCAHTGNVYSQASAVYAISHNSIQLLLLLYALLYALHHACPLYYALLYALLYAL